MNTKCKHFEVNVGDDRFENRFSWIIFADRNCQVAEISYNKIWQFEKGKTAQKKPNQFVVLLEMSGRKEDGQNLREGWMIKQGGRYKSWKKRFFKLKSNCLTYHKDINKVRRLQNFELVFGNSTDKMI